MSIQYLLLMILLITPFPLQADSKRGLAVTASPKASSGATSLSSESTNRGLLIGNNNYLHPKWPSLSTAHKDVEGLAKVLTKRYGFAEENILLIKDGTRRDILLAFNKMADLAEEKDQVLIFYAGHGEFDKREQGYWVPVDGIDSTNYISNGEVLDKIRAIKAKHKFLISDSCFSGNLFTATRSRQDITNKNTKIRSGYFLEKSRLVSVQGLSSGGNEPVSDGGPEWGGHSIFAYHTLAVLKANRQRYLSASLLGVKLAENVANDTARLFGSGSGQTPILSPIKNQGHQGGEFFFVPTDLGQIKVTPLIVFYNSTASKFKASNKTEVQQIIQKTLNEELKDHDVKIIKNITLTSDDIEQEMIKHLNEYKAEGALVYSLSGKVEKKITMMYQGVTYLTAAFKAYLFADNQLKHQADLELKPQIVTVRRWTTNPDKLQKYFVKVAEKTTRKWSGTQKDPEISYKIHKLMAHLEAE